MIEKQLEIIHRRSAAVEDFTNEERERMGDLLRLYSEGMRELQGKLQRAMDDQAETIEQAHSEYQQALKSTGIDFSSMNRCELVISGSGIKGVPRDTVNEVNNQRFLIHIVPVIGNIRLE